MIICRADESLLPTFAQGGGFVANRGAHEDLRPFDNGVFGLIASGLESEAVLFGTRVAGPVHR